MTNEPRVSRLSWRTGATTRRRSRARRASTTWSRTAGSSFRSRPRVDSQSAKKCSVLWV